MVAYEPSDDHSTAADTALSTLSAEEILTLHTNIPDPHLDTTFSIEGTSQDDDKSVISEFNENIPRQGMGLEVSDRLIRAYPHRTSAVKFATSGHPHDEGPMTIHPPGAGGNQ